MTNLIGISGQSGSGKDLIASIIQYLIWRRDVESNGRDYMSLTLNSFINNNNLGKAMSGFKVVKFADKLKDIVCLLTGCTRNDLEDREFKEQELPESWWYWKVQNHDPDNLIEVVYSTKKEAEYAISEDGECFYMYEPSISLFKPTYRYLLQYIGTDLFRNRLHPDTWVNATFSDYKPPKLSEYNPSQWLISDVRFPNELKAIKDRGGICIRVSRPPIEPDPHISESALDDSDDFDYMLLNVGTIDELVEKVKEILIMEGII